ncbi:MAG: response regulator, partial [Lachnospiraceae bacterium]|nr:response regulator [Lachnospiraceae bacterium]
MKIVICDDCMEDLVQVERLLQKYEKNADSKFEVETFSDASKVYHKVLQHELADIYILDMIMPQKSGIDIGSLLEKNGKSVVIYITSSNEFALEAYGVHAARYLLKPVSDAVFGEAMDYAVSQIRMNQNVLSQDIRYTVKTKEALVSVYYSDIVYIEN